MADLTAFDYIIRTFAVVMFIGAFVAIVAAVVGRWVHGREGTRMTEPYEEPEQTADESEAAADTDQEEAKEPAAA